MDVPFHPQMELAALAGSPLITTTWADRGCAIACATMVLGYYGRNIPMAEVLSAALERSAFDPERGWLHSGLVDVLKSFGLAAYRRNWRLVDGRESEYLAGRRHDTAARRELSLVKREMIEEGLWTIRRLLRAGVPVIASVYRPWGDRGSIGHQIVLLGMTREEIRYHEPAEVGGAFRRHRTDAFVESWKGLAIVSHPQYRLKAENCCSE